MSIIALLNLQYWCENENEKQRLKEVYAKNEEEYQQMLQAKYNTDNLFKKKTLNIEKEQVDTEVTQIVVYKESLIRKIINKFKNFFKIR